MIDKKKEYFWLKIFIFVGYIAVIIVMIISAGTLPEKFIIRQIGWIIFIIGFLLWLPARITIRRFHTSLPEAYKIVKTGIYSKIRHPIYISIEIMYIGFSLVLYSLWGFISTLALLTPLHIYRAYEEEKLFKKVFGAEYIEYKKKTWF
ncbi:MAG: methyltransferase family protein [bacterium]